MSDKRSDMALLMLGYFTGVALSKEFREHFKIREVHSKDAPDGGPPEDFTITFASGTKIRVRVEDAES